MWACLSLRTSLTSRERGLKYDQLVRWARAYLVAPFTGAWIEIKSWWMKLPLSGSLPSRERGLKLEKARRSRGRAGVAPFTGAWIEIPGWRAPSLLPRVAPFTGAWIEIIYGEP